MEDDKSDVTCVHTLTYPNLFGKFQVTELSWNSTGSVLAASYPFDIYCDNKDPELIDLFKKNLASSLTKLNTCVEQKSHK